MKRWSILAMVLFGVLAVVVADSADARRLGGGRTLGAQRQATPPPSGAPNVAPANPAAAGQAVPAQVAPGASGASRWLGPLAGLAAGIGLAALLSHFGLGEGFANFLLLALLVAGGIFLFRMLAGRRASGPVQYSGAGTAVNAISGGAPVPPAADPFAHRFEPVPASGTAIVADAPAPIRFAGGFDPAPFAQEAALQFRRLQAAYDAGDRTTLADVLTPEMFAEIDKEIAERGQHAPTEIAALDATVLEAVTEGDRHWASVHFKGMLREDGAVLAKPFDEMWNLVKPVDGKTGWQLAGIRQLS